MRQETFYALEEPEIELIQIPRIIDQFLTDSIWRNNIYIFDHPTHVKRELSSFHRGECHTISIRTSEKNIEISIVFSDATHLQIPVRSHGFVITNHILRNIHDKPRTISVFVYTDGLVEITD